MVRGGFLPRDPKEKGHLEVAFFTLFRFGSGGLLRCPLVRSVARFQKADHDRLLLIEAKIVMFLKDVDDGVHDLGSL